MTSEMKVLEMKIPLQIKSVLVGLFLCAVTPAFAAPIVGTFNDGNTTTSPDGYGGKSGNGWVDEWKSGGNRIKNYTGGVFSANPLNGGGNYFTGSVTTTSTTGGSGNSQGFFQRQIDKSAVGFTDISKPITISFDFRPETQLTLASQSYLIFGGTNANFATDGSNTWSINGTGGSTGTWNLGAGAGNVVNTGMSIVAGTVYHFTLEIDPTTRSYFATVSDGVTSFTTPEAILFRSTTTTNAGEWINFGAKLTNGTAINTSVSFSMDNLMIIPEPSTVALLTTAAGIAMVRMVRRRRSVIA